MELSQVMNEIRLVPENRLPEIHDLLRSFIPGPETGRDDTAKIMPKTVPKTVPRIMEFAGCWQDLTDGEFADFSQEIAARRTQAFSGRIGREAVID